MRDSLGYLGVLSVLYLVILASWIYHNVRIYRQKGPRRYVRRVPFDGSHDLLNRAISHETDLMGGQEIYVTVAGNRKAFVDASCVEAD